MVETRLYLQRAIPQLKTPMVLTGAMTPLGFEGSDGLQGAEWIAWAEREANRLDPLKPIPPSIVDEEERVLRRLHAVQRYWWADSKRTPEAKRLAQCLRNKLRSMILTGSLTGWFAFSVQ